MYPKPLPTVIQSSKLQPGTLNSFGTGCNMLEAKTAKVCLEMLLAPWGVRSNWMIQSVLEFGLCMCFNWGYSREGSWVKTKMFCLEEKVGQHCDRKKTKTRGSEAGVCPVCVRQ